MQNQNVGTLPQIHHNYNLAVFICRAQPLHDGHLFVIENALRVSDTLLILVGSSGEPRNYHNPFNYSERFNMIYASIPEAQRNRVLILPLYDFNYNLSAWIKGVQDTVGQARRHFNLDDFASVSLIGHSKDHSSYYLKMFPQWSATEVPNYKGLNATPVREAYFNSAWQNAGFSIFGEKIHEILPRPVMTFLQGFSRTADYRNMVEEYEFIEDYKRPYKGLKHPPIFQTVDACVVQSGHVLLVQRKKKPGRGLWALPGGFLEPTERIEDAVFRELKEETRIKVPEAVLRGSVITNRRFDAPHRSARGRTITDAFLIHLKEDVTLPKVKGSDDAAKAQWWPIADIRRDMFFEDHYYIINNLVALL